LFTFNTWTSKGTGNNLYISVTAHYVSSPVDKLNQWVLKEDQLAFTPLKGHHTRANIASIITNILNEYGISEKVSIVFMPCIDTDCYVLSRTQGSLT